MRNTLPTRYLVDRGNAWWMEDGTFMVAPKNSDDSIAWSDAIEVDFEGIRGAVYAPYVFTLYAALTLPD